MIEVKQKLFIEKGTIRIIAALFPEVVNQPLHRNIIWEEEIFHNTRWILDTDPVIRVCFLTKPIEIIPKTFCKRRIKNKPSPMGKATICLRCERKGIQCASSTDKGRKIGRIIARICIPVLIADIRNKLIEVFPWFIPDKRQT